MDVATFRIDVDLLRVYEARLLAGRGFEARDMGAARAAIVNRTFVDDLLEPSDRSARHAVPLRRGWGGGAPSDWYEIVGVVDDFPGLPRAPGAGGEPTVYHPMGQEPRIPPSCRSNSATRRRRMPPSACARSAPRSTRRCRCAGSCRCRRSTTSSDPRSRRSRWPSGSSPRAVLLLSAAGVHAMMSFTIAQRTREIGIRSALGAQPRHLLLGIFRGAMRQLALGIAAGSLLSIGAFTAVGTGVWSASGLLVTVAAVMAVVASLAAIGPARRILRIQTVEALRTEG